jgi:hypothetical protein
MSRGGERSAGGPPTVPTPRMFHVKRSGRTPPVRAGRGGYALALRWCARRNPLHQKTIQGFPPSWISVFHVEHPLLGARGSSPLYCPRPEHPPPTTGGLGCLCQRRVVRRFGSSILGRRSRPAEMASGAAG